jgi:predicted phosphodiesterase
MLAVYVRSQEWIDPATAARIGEMLGKLIQDPPGADSSIAGLIDLLAQLYVGEGRARDALAGLAGTLRQANDKRFKSSKRKIAHSRRASHLQVVLSDVHANLPALEAALDFVELLGIEDVVMLGDVVGYGPHPVECIERLANSPFQCIKGNHDYACSLEPGEQPVHPIAMSRDARWVVEWTAQRLNPEHRQWLRELPNAIERDGWLAVHGSPVDPNHFNGYVYEMTYERNLDELRSLGLRTCFHGHTHVRGVYARIRGKLDAFYTDDAQPLDKYLHALVCPGSIGQPRNGMPGAQLAVYDRDSRVVQFYSIAYAMERTIRDMQRHDFPSPLVARLETAT